jgi:pSer/pThr/pTyr-binding forkhead associated (FHA) protein
VSKKHAKIQLVKDSYYLYDNLSANGIYVNGDKIEKTVKLEDGDCIQFGKCKDSNIFRSMPL